MNLTISDIAKKSQVSRTTVSRVLNDKPDVKPETRKRVLEIIKKYNYQPSVLAKGNITKRSYTLGLVVPYDFYSVFINPFSSEVIKGICTEANAHGYYVLMCRSTNGEDYISMYNEKRVEGFMIINPDTRNTEVYEKLNSAGVPYIVTQKITCSVPTNYVDVDNVHGAEMAVEHLTLLGHKKIAIITGPGFLEVHKDRILGYKNILEKKGIQYRAQYVVSTDTSIEGGYNGAMQLLNQEEIPTAIFVAGDIQAIGAIKAIKNRNLSVPKDISIIGFDDIFLSKYIDPPLTTVKQQISRKGTDACRMLINYLEGNGAMGHEILMTELVIRSSTAAI